MKHFFTMLLCCFLLTGLFTGCHEELTFDQPTILYVKADDTTYIFTDEPTHKLPDGYVEIGTVKRQVPTPDEAENGDSACCDIGDNIYQNPDNPKEIYVYTRLFSGKEEYRYLKFEADKD